MLRGHREGPDRYKGPAALRGVRRLRPGLARVAASAASAALQLPDEGHFQADGLRPWFGGVGTLGLGWRSVQGLSAGVRCVGRPLLRRRWARQVPGGPSWRRDGSWGAAGGEPWSPLPLETALLGTGGLSARPGLAGAGTPTARGPRCGLGGPRVACQQFDFRPGSLWRSPRLATGAVTRRGRSPLAAMAVQAWAPCCVLAPRGALSHGRLGGASGQVFPAVPWSVPAVSAVFWTAPEAHVLAVSPWGWGPPGHHPVCLRRWGLKDCVVRSSCSVAWASGDILRD